MENAHVKHLVMPHFNEPAATVSALTTDDTKSRVDYRVNGRHSSPVQLTSRQSAPPNSRLLETAC